MYLQFNNTTNAYLQCCRLPMLQPNKWLPAAMLLPILQSANNAAGSLCCLITTMQHAPYAALLVQCCRLSTVAIPHCKWLSTAMLLPSKWLPTMLHEAPSMLRLPTCGDTALQVAPYEAPNSNAAAYTAGCQPWQYRTARGAYDNAAA
jgi:hypothetical protein